MKSSFLGLRYKTRLRTTVFREVGQVSVYKAVLLECSVSYCCRLVSVCIDSVC
jgi:hypothetical protein